MSVGAAASGSNANNSAFLVWSILQSDDELETAFQQDPSKLARFKDAITQVSPGRSFAERAVRFLQPSEVPEWASQMVARIRQEEVDILQDIDALFQACKEGEIHMFYSLVAQSEDFWIGPRDEESGDTFLHTAVRNGQHDLALYLVGNAPQLMRERNDEGLLPGDLVDASLPEGLDQLTALIEAAAVGADPKDRILAIICFACQLQSTELLAAQINSVQSCGAEEASLFVEVLESTDSWDTEWHPAAWSEERASSDHSSHLLCLHREARAAAGLSEVSWLFSAIFVGLRSRLVELVPSMQDELSQQAWIDFLVIRFVALGLEDKLLEVLNVACEPVEVIVTLLRMVPDATVTERAIGEFGTPVTSDSSDVAAELGLFERMLSYPLSNRQQRHIKRLLQALLSNRRDVFGLTEPVVLFRILDALDDSELSNEVLKEVRRTRVNFPALFRILDGLDQWTDSTYSLIRCARAAGLSLRTIDGGQSILQVVLTHQWATPARVLELFRKLEEIIDVGELHRSIEIPIELVTPVHLGPNSAISHAIYHLLIRPCLYGELNSDEIHSELIQLVKYFVDAGAPRHGFGHILLLVGCEDINRLLDFDPDKAPLVAKMLAYGYAADIGAPLQVVSMLSQRIVVEPDRTNCDWRAASHIVMKVTKYAVENVTPETFSHLQSIMKIWSNIRDISRERNKLLFNCNLLVRKHSRNFLQRLVKMLATEIPQSCANVVGFNFPTWDWMQCSPDDTDRLSKVLCVLREIGSLAVVGREEIGFLLEVRNGAHPFPSLIGHSNMSMLVDGLDAELKADDWVGGRGRRTKRYTKRIDAVTYSLAVNPETFLSKIIRSGELLEEGYYLTAKAIGTVIQSHKNASAFSIQVKNLCTPGYLDGVFPGRVLPIDDVLERGLFDCSNASAQTVYIRNYPLRQHVEVYSLEAATGSVITFRIGYSVVNLVGAIQNRIQVIEKEISDRTNRLKAVVPAGYSYSLDEIENSAVGAVKRVVHVSGTGHHVAFYITIHLENSCSMRIKTVVRGIPTAEEEIAAICEELETRRERVEAAAAVVLGRGHVFHGQGDWTDAMELLNIDSTDSSSRICVVVPTSAMDSLVLVGLCSGTDSLIIGRVSIDAAGLEDQLDTFESALSNYGNRRLSDEKFSEISFSEPTRLIHDKPADVDLNVLLQHLISLRGSRFLTGLNSTRLEEALKRFLKALKKGRGIQGLDREQHASEYRTLLIQVSHTINTLKNSGDESDYSLYAVYLAKEAIMCVNGVGEEIQQQYLRVHGQLLDGSVSGVSAMMQSAVKNAILQALDGVVALARNPTVRAQSVHYLNYIRKHLAACGYSLPADKRVMGLPDQAAEQYGRMEHSPEQVPGVFRPVLRPLLLQCVRDQQAEALREERYDDAVDLVTAVIEFIQRMDVIQELLVDVEASHAKEMSDLRSQEEEAVSELDELMLADEWMQFTECHQSIESAQAALGSLCRERCLLASRIDEANEKSALVGEDQGSGSKRKRATRQQFAVRVRQLEQRAKKVDHEIMQRQLAIDTANKLLSDLEVAEVGAVFSKKAELTVLQDAITAKARRLPTVVRGVVENKCIESKILQEVTVVRDGAEFDVLQLTETGAAYLLESFGFLTYEAPVQLTEASNGNLQASELSGRDGDWDHWSE